MTVSESSNLATSRWLGTATPANKQLVFRSGETWFSLPATAVREITIAPGRIKVPQCHRALVGLSHLRSDFVPVVFLNDLLDCQQATGAQRHNGATTHEHHQLLVLHATSPWALLIAEVVGLESLETILTPEGSWEELSASPVMGTAMHRDQIVQVLDPNRLLLFVQQVFDDLWNDCAASRSSSQPALRGAQ